MQNIIKVFQYIPHIKRQLVAITFLNLIIVALNAAQPYAFKIVIDEIVAAITNPAFNSQIIWVALGSLFGLRILTSIFNYFISIYGNQIFTGFVRDLRHAVLSRLTTLSIDYFEKTRTGAIMQRVLGNVSEVANWFYNTASNFLGQILTIIVSLALITHTSWQAGLLVTAGAAIYTYQQIRVLQKTRPIGKSTRKVMERSAGYLQETVSHISTVRSFGGEDGAVTKSYEALEEWRDLNHQRTSIVQRSILTRSFLNSTTIVGSIAIVAYGALQGQYTAGDILLISLYLQRVASNIGSFGRIFITTSEADITSERIVEMLETPPTVVDAPEAKELAEIKTVEFKNVSFKYPGKRKLTHNNVSFKLEPGQTLALVGPSGTGKTTVTKLLLRFYDVSDGAILINGTDIREFTQESLRRHMGVVMQDVALFNDTVEANLQLARPEASKTEVRAAAKQAHASVFIDKLAEKYKTMVGERGVKLSGGEKQRVAIARAILKQPQLIVLDEATSALDSESEQQVQAGLQELMKDRTAIVIAHRLSTIMNADQIVVMKDGAVAETGNHESLSAKKDGLYAKLVSLQRKGFVKG